MTITGSDGSLTGTDTLILDVCSFDDCGDFLQNVDGVAPTATDDSGGFKVNGQTYTFISNSGALYQSLFGAGRPTGGTFEKTWDASIASAYDRGGASSGSITGRIVVNFAAESASIVISGDLDNLLTGNNYNKGDLTFSDTHSIANIPAASSGGVLLIEETFNSQNSDEGGPFSYQYQIGLGDDGSGGLGVSGRVLIEDDPTYGSGTSINTEGPQILEPQ
jgi:hypothetical protein